MKVLKWMGAILVIAFMVGISGCSSTTEENTPKEWVKVASWAGSDMKTTETFTTTAKEFRVKWSTTKGPIEGDSLINIYVNGEASGSGQLIANKLGVGSDMTYVKEGPGNYYLEILGVNAGWNVTVEEQR